MNSRKTYRVMAAWCLALAIALAPVTALAAQTVDITSDHPGSVFGNGGNNGIATPTSQDPNRNALFINQATVGGSAYGGYSVNPGVSFNILEISDGSIVQQNAYGGYGGGAGAVDLNTVAILNSTVKGTVYGGYSVGGDLMSNIVHIHGSSTVSGPIYGGYSKQGNATFNVVALNASVNISNCDIYGGDSGDNTKDVTTGNSLFVSAEVSPYSVHAKNIINFSDYSFLIDPVGGKNQPALKVSGSFGERDFMSYDPYISYVLFFGSVADIEPGDVYTLVKANQIATSFSNSFNEQEYTAVLSDGTVTGTISLFNDSILYTITSVIPFGPGDSYSPTYTSRSLTDKPTGITVSGSSISPQSRLNVTKGYLHSAGCAACDEMRSRQAAGDVLALYDISLTGYHTGAYDVFIPFGGSGAGASAYTVLHCNKGVLEKQSAPYANGGVSTTWSKLSPFAIVRGADITVPDTVVVDPPKTGQGGLWGYGLVLLGLALLGRKQKNKDKAIGEETI